MKLFVYTTRPEDRFYCDRFSEKYGIEVGYYDGYPTADTVHYAEGYDAISFTPCPMEAPLIRKFHEIGIRYMVLLSIGYEHVDVEEARRLGIRVSNSTYPPDGVADYAIMMMLMCMRRITDSINRSRVQDFTLKNRIGLDFENSTVGIIGTGKIGSTVIRHLQGFGCKILAYDLYPNLQLEGLAEYVSLEELFKQSMIISVHAPANEQNYHLIDKKAIEMMPQGAIVVNCARGPLIDTAALIDGLESGKLGGAALDVLEDETGLYYANRLGDTLQNRELALLRSFPNVILSPHTAFYTYNSISAQIETNFKSLAAFRDGVKDPQEL